MAMIRRANLEHVTRDAVVLDLGDLKAHGDAIVARARADAHALVADAREERARLLAGAKDEGYAKGFAEGRAAGEEQGRSAGQASALVERREQLHTLDASWTAALKVLIERRDAMLLQARNDLLMLALAIAERVVKRAIDADPGVAARQAEALIQHVLAPSALVLRTHPNDEPVLRAALPALAATLKPGQVTVAADASLSRGSCVADTAGGGVIDASIEAQLTRIAEALIPPTSTTPPEGAGA